MSALESGLKAFGCGPLTGDRWVRVLYLDESGIGNLKDDPIVVVAGVIIHADTQWGVLANALSDLLSDAVPFTAPRPAHLHAKDIFHGSGEFPRNLWDRERRNKLLWSVGALVETYKIPVVWMSIDRKDYAKQHPDETPEEHIRDAYTTCAVGCFMQAEMYMRQQHNAAEVCSIVMEQNQSLQKRIPEMIQFMRDPGDQVADLLPGWEKNIPLAKIIDTPACQPKTASSILQLADYCAFAIKRRLENKPGYKHLTTPLAANLMKYGMESGYWNPVHMPTYWPVGMKYENRQFVTDEG